MSVKISAIIPAFNAEKYLERAVRSLLETGQADLEIIIINDGSTDRTQEIAEGLQQAEPSIIRVLQHEQGENLGVSTSRNLGIESSRGEFICFLDADDYVYPHRFQTAMRLLAEDSSADGVHELTEMVFSNEKAKSDWWEGEAVFGFTESIKPENLLGELQRGKCWATSAILVRKSIFEKCGLFEPGLKIAEDCHLWFRMAVTSKIISGDISQTISAYWRHSESAYQPVAENRLKMIEAMSRFHGWAKNHGVSKSQLAIIRQASINYALNGLMQARGASQRKLAWLIVRKSLQDAPGVLKERRFYSHVVRMVIGR